MTNGADKHSAAPGETTKGQTSPARASRSRGYGKSRVTQALILLLVFVVALWIIGMF